MYAIGDRPGKNPQKMESSYIELHGTNCEKVPLLSGAKPIVNEFLEEAEIITSDFIYRKRGDTERMRTLLTAFFMNPIEKWKLRRRFPWKLCLQVLILVLGFVQMYWFGVHRARHLKQNSEMRSTLNRIFLKDWVAPDEPNVYPEDKRLYAVYTAPDFYKHVGYAIGHYMKLNSLAIGSYGYDSQDGTLPPIVLCHKQYEGYISPEESIIEIQSLPEEKCLPVPIVPPYESSWENFPIEDLLHKSNFSVNFGTLIHFNIHFRLRTVFIKSMNKMDFPECYRLNITIKYDNTNHDGQIPVSLKIESSKVNCQVKLILSGEAEDFDYLQRQLLSSFIIIFSFVSIILCLRSTYRGCKLSQEAVLFFKYYYGKTVPLSERMDFIDFWYLNIIAGDVLVVLGSYLKLRIEEKSTEVSEYTNCSILLGIGHLLILIGTLRYFRLFPTYNILILTLKKAMPNVLRFLICVLLLFTGYCFCGWMVLGPYHTKFMTLSSTADSLFADMNGDEVYGTFTMLVTDLDSIWWFTRFYLYSFFFLFLYLAASLLVSVIMDTFEMVKHMYVHGKTPSTIVEIFLDSEECKHMPSTSSESTSLYVEENEFNYLRKFLMWLKFNH